MNVVLKLFLSMSFSGSLLILALLGGKRLLKDRLSRQWQYYIWLVVIVRLLLPFGPETSLMGKTYQTLDRAITQAAPSSQQQPIPNTPGDRFVPIVGLEQNNENKNDLAEGKTTAHLFQKVGTLLVAHIWLVWLAVALGLLIRKITLYQGFRRYIDAGATPVSDIELLDRLSILAQQESIKKPIELCVNPLVSCPLLIGFLHPCVVLPCVDISEKDFSCTVLHELTHYKRRDMLYKWLVQLTVCLHWFNPLVHLMSGEITKACEFSCDEAVLAKMGCDKAQDYGETLLNAMAAVGKYQEHFGAVTLSENKELLKERIGAIMNFKKRSTAIRILTGMLTLCVMFGAVFIGVYPAAAVDQSSSLPPVSESKHPTQAGTKVDGDDPASQAERYYEADSLPLFGMTFSRLDENAQKQWLEKLYEDGDFAFFSVAVRSLDTSSSLLADFAEKAYAEKEMAFFSTLTDRMDKSELESWLDRALEDGIWSFQSILFDKLGKDEDFDELKEKNEKEWAEAQTAEYRAVGVTMDGKDYNYQGQLVNIFLDIRANGAFYTLNTNPKGTVNIKIIRDGEDKITGVAYMTEAEVTQLLENMSDADD